MSTNKKKLYITFAVLITCAFVTKAFASTTLSALGIGIGTAPVSGSVITAFDAGGTQINLRANQGASTGYSQIEFDDSAASNAFRWSIGSSNPLFSDGIITGNNFWIFQQTDTSGSDVSRYDFLINDSGQVGIGTGSPIYGLDVRTSDSGNDAVNFENNSISGYSAAAFSDYLGSTYLDIGYGNPSSPAPYTGIDFIGTYGKDLQIMGGASGNAPTMTFQNSTGNVGIGTTTPNARAILDLTSTTKAFMPPRMTTTQRNAIVSPTAGMVIYNTTTNKLNVYTTTWEAVTSA